MDKKTQQKLIDLTSEFYATVATSFSETRQNAWAGWEKVLGSVDLPNDYTLLDVACGNLRFEKFLLSRATILEDSNRESEDPLIPNPYFLIPQRGTIPARAICIDNCEPLLPEDAPSFVTFKKANLFVEQLSEEVDFAVCFGFMHHIPSFERRKNFLVMLMECVKQNGYAAISFWQFMKDERIAKKAEDITANSSLQLGENDYLLGWKNRSDVLRYCHNFTDEEIDELLKDFCVISSFSEDGKSHNLNKYVILKKL